MPEEPWEVIAPVDLRDQMEQVVMQIASRLPLAGNRGEFERPALAGVPDEHSVELARGTVGRELFRWYYSDNLNRVDREVLRARMCRWLIDTLAEEALAPGLFCGVAGLMWFLWHGPRPPTGPGSEYEQAFAEFDVTLAHALSSWQSAEYDLISGLCGLGVYALERSPSEATSSCLELVVGQLAASAQRDRRGVWWKTPVELLSATHRSMYVEGWCDLGMAHGLGGVVGLLAQVLEDGRSHTMASRLLEPAVDFVIAIVHEHGNGTDLPSALPIVGGRLANSRLLLKRPAWCYGSLGVACAISRAAVVAGNKRWESVALKMARAHSVRLRSLKRSDEDTGLCHGIAGVAHMLNRLYQRTGDFALRDAAVRSYERLLKSRVDSGRSVAGFQTRMQIDETNAEWIPAFGFLYGAAGIGLTFLAASRSTPPTWDRLLLI